MNLMLDAAETIRDITTDIDDGFATPVIFSVTNGVVVTAKTCNAIPIVHQLHIDERGMMIVAPTARIMVSELALVAAGYPTRDTNNKLVLKDNAVTFTDVVTGVQATYIIREAIGNSMSGLISCTLGNAGVVTPPGRIIIGWMPASIIVNVTATPGAGMQTLANGDVILTDYSLNGNRTLTIPYMVNYNALSTFLLNGRQIQDIQYTKSSGTFSNAAHGGFNNSNAIKFDATIPIWQS